jgi:hypothetical protein
MQIPAGLLTVELGLIGVRGQRFMLPVAFLSDQWLSASMLQRNRPHQSPAKMSHTASFESSDSFASVKAA